MHEIENTRYPHINKPMHPPICICTGLTLMVGSITLSCIYQSTGPFTFIFLYSLVAMGIGVGQHIQSYVPVAGTVTETE